MLTLTTADNEITTRLVELFIDPAFRITYFQGALDGVIAYAESTGIRIEETWSDPACLVS